MCMITYVPRGVEVPTREILNGATWNDMGHGWAVIADTGLILTGRFWDAEAAVETFNATRKEYMEYPAVFHSRLATHGAVSLHNVHPFPVGKFAVVAHNGILPTKFQPVTTDTRSDTAILAEEFLPGWSEITGVWSRRQRRRIGRIIGANKLVILSSSPFLKEPRGWIINESMGRWAKGCWFSNTDYKSDWYSERRYNSGYSGWWNDGDDYAVIGRKAIDSARSFTDDDECVVCYAKGGIDAAGDICTYCESCQSCGLPTNDGSCMCYRPESMRREIETIESRYLDGDVVHGGGMEEGGLKS